jgi:hypothetical protein
MMYFLEHASPKAVMDNMDAFRQLRSSKEVWETFKRETTSAEFATVEMIWEIYLARLGLHQSKTDLIQTLSTTLAHKIPLNGLETRDITWESLHSTLLTVRVCLTLKYLLTSVPPRKDDSLKSSLAVIAETAVAALTTCVEKLEIKRNMCTARSDDDTLNRLSNSVIEDVAYMQSMKQLVRPFSKVLLIIVER